MATDSFPDQFTRRNQPGVSGGILMRYGINGLLSINTGAHFTRTGYKLSNDSNNYEPFIRRSFSSVNIPLFLTLKQRFSATAFIQENVGISWNYRLSPEPDGLLYNKPAKNFAIRERIHDRMTPNFHFGIEFLTLSESANALNIGINYYYSLGHALDLDIYGNPVSQKRFEMMFRGGYLSVGLTWLYNVKNLKKTEEFFQ